MIRLFRQAVLPALALLAAGGCSSAGSGNTNYSQFYQIVKQSLAASFGKIRVTRDQAAAIPYASLGYSLDGGNQAMLVLATDTNGELLWTSPSHVVVVTRDGRIVRTLGLPHDLSALTTTGGPPPAVAEAVRRPFSSSRQEDFPELGFYGITVSCQARLVGRQKIVILGQEIATNRVDESCRSEKPVLAVMDGESGKVVTTLPIGRGNDGVIFDADSRQIYTSNGVEANLVIYSQVDANTYKLAEAVTTRPYARTMALDATSKKVYTVTAEGVSDPAKKINSSVAPFYPNTYYDNTFTVLTYTR